MTDTQAVIVLCLLTAALIVGLCASAYAMGGPLALTAVVVFLAIIL